MRKHRYRSDYDYRRHLTLLVLTGGLICVFYVLGGDSLGVVAYCTVVTAILKNGRDGA